MAKGGKNTDSALRGISIGWLVRKLFEKYAPKFADKVDWQLCGALNIIIIDASSRKIKAFMHKLIDGKDALANKIGRGFPFITYCDPAEEVLRMNVKGKNGLENDFAMKICGDERWHYVLQFVRANKSRITLKPYRRGKPIDLSLVFRDNKGYNHRTFYLFTRTTRGSKAKYWLEQTQLRPRGK